MSSARSYFSLIMGPSSGSFLHLFQEKWDEHLQTLPKKYRAAEQLRVGSRFRPLLVAWGYILAGASFEDNSRSQLADVAVYIELLHKATILIDDLIDGDPTRRGQASFHVEFSDDEAIVFAIHLLGDCLSQLANSAGVLHIGRCFPEVIELLARAIKDMSLGTLEEVGCCDDELESVAKVKRIIELQTIALVSNGLLVGYKFGGGDSTQDDLIDSLGHDCGYLFQALNDLEPFLAVDLHEDHKGAATLDTSGSRKNLAVASIFSQLSHSENRTLRRLRDSNQQLFAARLAEWFETHDIAMLIVENLAYTKKNIDRNIDRLRAKASRRHDFETFVDYVLSAALDRLGEDYRGRLSKILIR